jgi:hypothetical protein
MSTTTAQLFVLAALAVGGLLFALGYQIARRRHAPERLLAQLRAYAGDDVDERDLWLTWETFQAWLRWTNKLRGAENEREELEARAALAQLPHTTSYAALTAGTELGKSVLRRRWYAAQAAREAGESWDTIGSALGLSGRNAELWYQSTAAEL